MSGPALWQDNKTGLKTGVAASVLLHGLMVLFWLLWAQGQPALKPPILKAMMVELVTPQPLTLQAAPGPGAPAANRRASVSAAAPHGVMPKAIKPSPDEIEAQINSLANLKSPDSAMAAPDNGVGPGGAGAGGGYGLADFVRAQILRRWWPSLGSDAARGMPVAIRLTLSRDGVISNVRILDQARFDNDKLFRGMAISARNAALLASPIALPPVQYPASMEIALTLDPRAALR